VAIPVILPDANVLFTFALRDTILMAAERDLCRVRWSVQILEETRRSLIRNGIMSDERAANLIRVMQAAFPDALVEDYEQHIARMTNHPDDRHVAAAALHAGAHAIVTFSLRHFRLTALAPHGLRAQHPDAFLLDLFTNNAAMMVAMIEQQARERHRPVRTAMQIVDGLALLTPQFAATVILHCLTRKECEECNRVSIQSFFAGGSTFLR
jgi:predicted nucleic acid-binding protein